MTDYGARQLQRYSDLIKNAIGELEAEGDKALLLKHRPEIGDAIYSFPFRRNGRNSRHHLYLRFDRTTQDRIVRVVRVLHERMDVLVNLFKDE